MHNKPSFSEIPFLPLSVITSNIKYVVLFTNLHVLCKLILLHTCQNFVTLKIHMIYYIDILYGLCHLTCGYLSTKLKKSNQCTYLYFKEKCK